MISAAYILALGLLAFVPWLAPLAQQWFGPLFPHAVTDQYMYRMVGFEHAMGALLVPQTIMVMILLTAFDLLGLLLHRPRRRLVLYLKKQLRARGRNDARMAGGGV